MWLPVGDRGGARTPCPVSPPNALFSTETILKPEDQSFQPEPQPIWSPRRVPLFSVSGREQNSLSETGQPCSEPLGEMTTYPNGPKAQS